MELPGTRLLLALALPVTLAFAACAPLTPDDDDASDDDSYQSDDDASDDDATGDDDAVTPIQDLQSGQVPSGTFVTLRSVVVTSPVRISSDGTDGGFFVQEQEGGENSALYVYTWADVIAGVSGLDRGAVVSLSGEYSEFPEGDPAGSMAELTITQSGAIEVEGAGVELAPEPVPASVLADPASAEPWEAVLIETSGVVESGADEHGVWVVDGVAVDDVFHHVEPFPGATVVRLAGPFDFSYGAFKVLPRDEADVEIDDSTVPVTDTTIPAIRGGEVDPGTVVRLTEVVASSGLTWPFSYCSLRAFWVQDPAGGPGSGIQVIVPTASLGTLAVQAGDVVDLRGVYDEFNGVSQIALSEGADVTVTSNGPSPEPESISDTCSIATGGSVAEDYEGVLVSVGHLEVTATADDYGEFEVEGCLLVDDAFFELPDEADGCGGTVDASPDPPLGQSLAVTGVLAFSFENFKLEPRSTADFAGWTP